MNWILALDRLRQRGRSRPEVTSMVAEATLRMIDLRGETRSRRIDRTNTSLAARIALLIGLRSQETASVNRW